MPWFKKEKEVPEDLKGLDDEQIVALIKAGREAGAKVTELEKELNTRNETVDSMSREFNEVKARLKEIEEGDGDDPPPTNQPKPIPSILEDEAGAFAARTAPLEAAVIHTGAITARMQCENQLRQQGKGKMWDKFASEIDAVMAKEPPASRIMPQKWLAAFTFVKGIHFDEVMDAAGKNEDFFGEPADRNTPPPPPPDNKDKLSDKELEVCKKMKVDPKKYLEQRKKIQVTSMVG